MEVENNNLVKIAIVGPESTGKSTMANFLAKKFNSICVPEYARYYCKSLNNQYTLQDEINMYYGQIALEDAIVASTQQNVIFCDTTILTVKIWSDHLFKHTPQFILDEITNRKYDLYLLMDIDLPWEHDPLRDFPNEREHFMNVWIQELNALQANYVIINSEKDERLMKGYQTYVDFLKNTYK